MKGFVRNISNEWAYAMKRTIKPGGEVPLVELYEQYGVKHNIAPNEDFVDWLTKVKLNDPLKWKIVYGVDADDASFRSITKKQTSEKNKDFVAPIVIKGYSVEDIIMLSVRKAREVIPNIVDLNLLKYSLTEINKLSNKDNVRRLIMKRIGELQSI